MHIAIIGAGAAGCFAAANIPYVAGRQVTVLEKTGKTLQKVKVSGGGRCNVTHACFDIPELIDRYPRGKQLLRKSLYRFSPKDTVSWFEQHGVKLKTEDDGRMFPVTDSSQTIIDCLWQEMIHNKAEVLYHRSVERIERGEQGFIIHFVDAPSVKADRILVSSGGYPKPDQYKWLEALGHTIQPPAPSLFTFNMPKHPITELMGVVAENATIKISGTKIIEQGPILITHWGLSGPAVLRTSAWGARELQQRNYEFQVMINWLGDVDEAELKDSIAQLRREQGKQIIQSKNPFSLPRRLWEYLLEQSGIKADVRWGELPAANQNKLIEHLIRDIYQVKGKTTFKEEFVTCGGITLSEIDPQTMQSRKVSGLFFAGEIMDVDGITGGYNFQNAWSSAWIAAQNIIL
jgi:hypothetical protein